ncbi:MAG: hypothetical protein AAF738_01820 [Bacteroidota bacterium]
MAFALLIAIACTEPPMPIFRQEDRQLVDSLFSKYVDSVRYIRDSQCNSLKIRVLEEAVDSIMKQRLVERAKLKSKYENATKETQ